MGALREVSTNFPAIYRYNALYTRRRRGYPIYIYTHLYIGSCEIEVAAANIYAGAEFLARRRRTLVIYIYIGSTGNSIRNYNNLFLRFFEAREGERESCCSGTCICRTWPRLLLRCAALHWGSRSIASRAASDIFALFVYVMDR